CGEASAGRSQLVISGLSCAPMGYSRCSRRLYSTSLLHHARLPSWLSSANAGGGGCASPSDHLLVAGGGVDVDGGGFHHCRQQAPAETAFFSGHGQLMCARSFPPRCQTVHIPGRFLAV